MLIKNSPITEAATRAVLQERCTWKFRKIHRKIPVPEACNFIKKETLAEVFSFEFCEIFKNTFFTEHLRATASAVNAYIEFLRNCLGLYDEVFPN